MPSKSAKQAKFMRAIAAGWKPDRMKNPPSRAVAREFVEADKERGKYYEGGEVNMFYGGPLRRALRRLEEQRARQAEEGYEPWMAYGTEPLTWDQIGKDSAVSKMVQIARMRELGWTPDRQPASGGDEYAKNEIKELTWYPPSPPTLLGDQTGQTPPPTSGYDPYYGRGRFPGRTGRGGRRGRDGGRRVPPERTPPGPVTPPPGNEVPPDRIVPTSPPPATPPRRQVPDYASQLQAHKQRVASALGVPPGGFAEGGAVNFKDGGAANAGPRPGHPEDATHGRNPYPPNSARYRLWERKYHQEPEAPPAETEEVEEEGGLFSGLFGRSERELEKLEERARGGYMSPAHYIPASREVGYGVGGYIPASREKGYQMGGLAMMTQPRMMPTRMPMQLPPRMGGMPPRMSPPLKMPPGMRMAPPPNKMPGGMEPAGPVGGPRVPPNLRGYLQRMRMQNRPPAMTGRGVNRVGQGDQQGALARALQRGTGRPPMSRRQGFYR